MEEIGVEGMGFFGPGGYSSVCKKILYRHLDIPLERHLDIPLERPLERHFQLPFGPLVANALPLIYSIPDNLCQSPYRSALKGGIFVSEINLWTSSGVFVVSDLHGDGGLNLPEPAKLEAEVLKANGGKEVNGVMFSRDNKVRFAPVGSYNLGGFYSADEWREDGLTIARFGLDGAQSIAELTRKLPGLRYDRPEYFFLAKSCSIGIHFDKRFVDRCLKPKGKQFLTGLTYIRESEQGGLVIDGTPPEVCMGGVSRSEGIAFGFNKGFSLDSYTKG